MYTISVELDRARLLVVMGQALLKQDGPAFAREMKAATLALLRRWPWFDILADFSPCGILAQPVAAASVESQRWFLDNGLRKSATVSGSALMRLQLDHLAGDPRIRTFADVAAADAWLREGWADRARIAGRG